MKAVVLFFSEYSYHIFTVFAPDTKLNGKSAEYTVIHRIWYTRLSTCFFRKIRNYTLPLRCIEGQQISLCCYPHKIAPFSSLTREKWSSICCPCVVCIFGCIYFHCSSFNAYYDCCCFGCYYFIIITQLLLLPLLFLNISMKYSTSQS